MNYTVCWKHFVVTDGTCPYCTLDLMERDPSFADGMREAMNQFTGTGNLTCGFCNTSRPLHINRCPVCSEWEKPSHSGSREYPAPSREDAHQVRLLLRSVCGVVPGIKWSRR